MSKKNVSGLLKGMGVAMSIITTLVQKAKLAGLTDEDLYSLVTPRGELMLECFVRLMVHDLNRRTMPRSPQLMLSSLDCGKEGSPILWGHLSRVADMLGWREVDLYDWVGANLDALSDHRIVSRETLLAKGPDWFANADFPPYGNGRGFASRVLGEPVFKLTEDHLRRIATRLNWPGTPDEERAVVYRASLAAHGITDLDTLLAKGPDWFAKAVFAGLGTGPNFLGRLLCETIVGITVEHLYRMAVLLGWADSDEVVRH